MGGGSRGERVVVRGRMIKGLLCWAREVFVCLFVSLDEIGNHMI